MKYICCYIFLCCAIQKLTGERYSLSLDGESFQTEFSWSYINFTWESETSYLNAVKTERYIPENIMPAGPRIYKDKLYLNLPKFRTGVPVTLSYIPIDTSYKNNHLLVPFPNWEMNNVAFCWNIQSVLGTEIDTKGIMWVLDGHRVNNNITCPPKLLLLDLNNNGRLLHTFVFPNEICLQDGGFLNDVVIDETDGTFAYITDNSNIDPGLIVYSKSENRAWKLRHGSMFPQLRAANFIVDNTVFDYLGTIDGIALSPLSPRGRRTLFYTALTGFNLYGIDTYILKNEQLTRSDRWRNNVAFIGEKQSQTDGMIMDNRGNLYYGLLDLYGIGKWNMFEPFEFSSEVIYSDRETTIWPDGFTMDQKGYLYLISNSAFRYFDSNKTLQLTPDIKFRIHKMYTGTRNYMYG